MINDLIKFLKLSKLLRFRSMMGLASSIEVSKEKTMDIHSVGRSE